MQRALAIVCAILACAAALAVYWSFDLDDAFITYRIAENLVRGNGFVYNVGERVQVGTTPLWTMTLALAGIVGLSVPRTALVLSVVLLAAAAYLVALLGKPAHPRLYAVALVLFVVPNFFLLSTAGMESALYLCLAAAAALLFERRRPVALGFCCGLLALTRTDGILLAMILGGWALWKRDRAFVPAVLPLGLVLVAWYLFAWSYFGHPSPVTLSAKIAQGRSGLWGEGAIFVRGIGRWLRGIGNESRLSRWLPLPLFWLVPILAAWGLRRASVGTRAIALHAALVTAAYGVLNVPDYHWYYAPLVFALLVLGAVGAASIPNAAVGTVFALLVAFANARTLVARHGTMPFPAAMAYRDAARAIVEERGPSGTLSAAEIGILGYTSGLRMCDWLGLACPEATPLLAARQLDRFLATAKPDLLLVHEPLWPQEATLFGGVEARRYFLARSFRGKVALLLFARGEAPAMGGAVAIPESFVLHGGPVDLSLPPFDARGFEAMKIEASRSDATSPRALLVLRLRPEAADGYKEPYRAEVPLAADTARHAYEVPIAGDWRFWGAGRVMQMTMEAVGCDVTLHSLALGSRS